MEAYIKEPQEHLCVAVACNDVVRICQLLSLSGVDVNQRDYLGRTPLQVAVLNGHLEIVRILLGHGAKCTARMNDGKIVMHVAATFGFDEILKLLLEKSEANRRAAGERERETKVVEMMNVDEETVGKKIEMDKEEMLPNDIIDINIPDWEFDVSLEIHRVIRNAPSLLSFLNLISNA